jgi:hypothetical protein
VSTEAKVTLSFINRRTSQMTRLDDFRLRPDLAVRLVEQIEALLADLAPGQARVSRTVTAKGATVIDLDLKPITQQEAQPAAAKPTFEQLYRRSGPGNSDMTNRRN